MNILKLSINENKIKNLVILQINDLENKVDSNGKEYYVDYAVGNCVIGKHGAPCKHKYDVVNI